MVSFTFASYAARSGRLLYRTLLLNAEKKKKKITWWRDARPEDIMVEEEISISEEIVQ